MPTRISHIFVVNVVPENEQDMLCYPSAYSPYLLVPSTHFVWFLGPKLSSRAMQERQFTTLGMAMPPL